MIIIITAQDVQILMHAHNAMKERTSTQNSIIALVVFFNYSKITAKNSGCCVSTACCD
jgi:hypothetical protein